MRSTPHQWRPATRPKVLPMTVIGDRNNPIQHQYEVTLTFGQRAEQQRTPLESEDGMQDVISGPAPDIKALAHMRSS
jgi:hypothetical protein